MFLPYSVQALRWKQLSSTGAAAAASSPATLSPVDTTIGNVQENLRQVLHEKPWLLEEDQHLEIPPTHFDDHSGRIFSVGDFCKRVDQARELDVQECSADENGNRRLLTQEQIQHLKQTGELIVPSELFENQYHTWKVKPSFYSGRQTVSNSLGEGVGKALDHYVVYTSDAVGRKDDNRFHPTLRNALANGVAKAGKKLREATGQLFVGRLQHRTYSDGCIDYVLQNAERSYVSYHLQERDTTCMLDPVSLAFPIDGVGQSNQYWDILETEGHSEFVTKYRPSYQDDEKEKEDRQKLVSMRQVFQERMQRKRRVQLNVDQERCLKDPQAALKDIQRADAECREKNEEEWLDHLRNITDEELQELGRLEADRLRAIRVEKNVEREDNQEVERQLNDYNIALKKKRRILYMSKEWRNRKLEAKRLKLDASIQSSRSERIVKRLDDEGLTAQSAARKLAVQFREELREQLAEQLRSKRSPFPPATFKVLQLDPNHWTFHGGGSINRYKTVEVDLGKPFWRLRYTSLMAVKLTKGMIGGAFHFLVSGPLSLRALFSPRPYYAMERPARDERSFTQTLLSRLQSFYAALKDVRANFDASPDTGLIGKSIQSFFLRIHLAVKGVVGTVAIVFFMTVGTVLATSLGLLVLTLAPVLAGTITLAATLFNLVIYDTAMSAAHRRACCEEDGLPSCLSPLVKISVTAPYYLIVPGAIQTAFAAARAAIVHPVVGTCVLSWACFRYLMRSLRDSLTWFFIAKYSRIPSSDSFLAWRIHGPGLAPKEYYRLPVNAAKTGVLLMLDKYRLCAHAEVRRSEMDAPYHRYSRLFTELVDQFGVNASLRVPSPSSISSGIVWRSQARQAETSRTHEDPSSMSRRAEHPFDIWDTVADGIRASHPYFEDAQERHIMDQWEASEIAGETFSDRHNIFEGDSELESLRRTALGEIVRRAGILLAEWNLNISQRDRRLSFAMSIPKRFQGCFRMSEAELQDLWEFTRTAAEMYGRQIKEELEEILETSEFSKEIRQAVVHASNSFYTNSGARAGQDIPVVAAFLLKTLLGGFDMLETLEAADERMVLSPKLSKEDEHLIFWKSVTDCIDNDQSWVMPWPEPL